MRVVPPTALHKSAMKQAYSVDDLPWHLGVDRSRPFAPESLSHLFYCPSYTLLTEEEKTTYSQVIGLAIAEQFVFLEEYLLVPAVEGVLDKLGRRLDPVLRQCLLDFIIEEYKHSEMFWRLLEAAAPDWYAERQAKVYQATGGRKTLLEWLTNHPTFFVLWIWMGVLFEERTIDLHRKYSADPKVDPLFKEVHRFHMLDESRHVRIDEHLLKEIYLPAPDWVKRLNVALMKRILGMYTAPKLAPMKAIGLMIERHPRLAEHEATFRRDIAGLRQNRAFQTANYSRQVLPQTFHHLDQFPEMRGLGDALPLYSHDPHSPDPQQEPHDDRPVAEHG